MNLGEKKIEAYLMETIRDEMEQLKLEYLERASAEETRDYKAEIAALRAKMRKVNHLYINELISFEECRAENESFAAQIEALEREPAQREQPDLTAAEKALVDGWEAMYLALSQEEKQAFWRLLIKEIRIYPDYASQRIRAGDPSPDAAGADKGTAPSLAGRSGKSKDNAEKQPAPFGKGRGGCPNALMVVEAGIPIQSGQPPVRSVILTVSLSLARHDFFG